MTKQEIKDKVEPLVNRTTVSPIYTDTRDLVDWIYDTFVSHSTKEKEVAEWIGDWTELFPVGKQIKSSPKDCLKKMVKFTKDYPEYDKDCIFAATKNYLKEKSEDDYKYTKKATNLIHHKYDGSLLATICEEERAAKIRTISREAELEKISYPQRYFY